VKYKLPVVLNWFADNEIVAPEWEYKFDEQRNWRFDFAWPEKKVALEVEGGIYTHGRHGRGSGIAKDIEKYNQASVLGWKVLRVTPENLCIQETAYMLKKVL